MQTIAILAMSVDGKIAEASGKAARFGSQADRAHLESVLATADAILMGANTLRAYQTALPISHPVLLAERQQRQQAIQPVQIVCSRSGLLDPTWRFFRQSMPRWLLTTPSGAMLWQGRPEFEQILPVANASGEFVWPEVFQQFAALGWQRLVVSGGGQLMASLLAAHLIDELYLTLCPLLLGGDRAPTLVTGQGWLAEVAPRLKLLSVRQQDDELFLHYAIGSPNLDCSSARLGS